MKRAKHSLSHYNLHTFDMGQLIPISWYEALPGDSIRQSSSALLRLSPLLTPVMHPVQVRIHHWFVPNRILWDGWEDFITGVDTEEPPPFMEWAPTAKSLPDYMGIGPYTPMAATHSFSLLPIRAYNMIYNEFYRDQDLVSEVDEDNMVVQNCAWEKDYFTAARPFAQQGDPVTMALGERAEVRGIGIRQGASFTNTGQAVVESDGSVVAYANSQDTQDGSNLFEIEENPTIPGAPNVWADLSTATGVDVNEIRLLFALQRYKEARAQYGSRYTEYLRYLGVRSSDARLQRPEYLGGGKSTVSFSEVLRTATEDSSEGQALGQMAGHGIAAVKSRRWVKFFEEHGIVMTVASLRPRSIYANGIHRSWLRETKEDYWQKELELIGQQQVLRREVYAADATSTDHFGYQDRYSEYRHLPSYVTSEFRTTLNDWHLARIFGSAPALNADFVNCVPTKRVFAEQTQNSIWGMFSHHIQARRLVGKRTIGRII